MRQADPFPADDEMLPETDRSSRPSDIASGLLAGLFILFGVYFCAVFA